MSRNGKPLVETKKTKGALTREKAIQGAIHCIAQLGYDQTTFQAIADYTGLSQPLVVHYFKNKDSVFPTVIEYLSERADTPLPPDWIQSQSADVLLREYLKASLKQFHAHQDAAKVYLTLSFLAAFQPRYQAANKKIKQANIRRIVQILQAGVSEGIFKVKNLESTAEVINSLLIGLFIDRLTGVMLTSDRRLISILENTCLSLVQYSPRKN